MCSLHQLSVTSLPPDVPSSPDVSPPWPQQPPAPAAIHRFSDMPMTFCDQAGSPPYHGLSHLPPAPAPHHLCHLSLPPCTASGSPPCQLLDATAALYRTSAQGNTAATVCALAEVQGHCPTSLGRTCHLPPAPAYCHLCQDPALLSHLIATTTAWCHIHLAPALCQCHF